MNQASEIFQIADTISVTSKEIHRKELGRLLKTARKRLEKRGAVRDSDITR